VKPPLDTDLHLPAVLSREQAAERLLELLADPDDADRIWDEIIGSLYDSRQWSSQWRNGHCRHCRVEHPAWWAQRHPADRQWPGHRTYCPRYVGPLEHHETGGHHAFMGWRQGCSCGQSWLQYDDEGNKQTCPDAALDWRGPRPEAGQ
jgi:hypothetical protein